MKSLLRTLQCTVFGICAMLVVLPQFTNSAMAQAKPPAKRKSYVAYIYSRDMNSAKDFKQSLEKTNYKVDLILINAINKTNFAKYSFILIGSDTQRIWTDAAAKTVDDAKKPILGLGEGGYSFFGKLKLRIGSRHGWHGRNTGITALANPKSRFWTSSKLKIPADKQLVLYKQTNHVGIHIPKPPRDIVLIGQEQKSKTHYAIVQQGQRYVLWGFTASPKNMTPDGRRVFLHTCRYVESLQTFDVQFSQ